MSGSEAMQNPSLTGLQAGDNERSEFTNPLMVDYQNGLTPDQLIVEPDNRWQRILGRFSRPVAAVLFMATVSAGVASCGASQEGSSSKIAPNQSAECVSNSEYLANQNATGPDSFFPSLYDSNHELISASSAERVIINEVCNDVRTLATFSAINELFQNQTLPNTDIVNRIAKLESNYTANSKSRKQAERDVITLLKSGLVPNNSFAITAGQISQLKAEKKGTVITGISLASPKLNSSSLEGYTLNPNPDNTNITKSERDFYYKLSSLILIAPDGTIYFNDLISENPSSAQFGVSNTRVNTTPNGTQNTQAFQGTGNNQGVSQGSVPESNPNGPQPGPGNGPNGAGTTPEAGPGQGNTPGTGGGGNQGGGETPTTITSSTVPVTTSPTTTPNTIPSTTIPTSTTTTTLAPKPPSPCNSNDGQVCPP